MKEGKRKKDIKTKENGFINLLISVFVYVIASWAKVFPCQQLC